MAGVNGKGPPGCVREGRKGSGMTEGKRRDFGLDNENRKDTAPAGSERQIQLTVNHSEDDGTIDLAAVFYNMKRRRRLFVWVLVLCLVPAIVQIVSPEFADSLRTGSALYSYVMQMDFLNVQKFVTSLVGG